MEQRERLIPRFNRSQPASQCRAIISFSLMLAVTISLVVIGLVLTGQASSAHEMWKHHARVCDDANRVQNIAHRGSSGMRPAHSKAAYELAADQGADFIECDLGITKDLKLICIHDGFLSSVTDISDHSDFADRKRNLLYNKEEIDDWWVIDFTLEELRTLRLKQEFDDRDQSFNGEFTIPTFAEYIAIALEKDIDIYPELKTPSFFADHLNVNFEALLLSQLNLHELAPERVLVQSFDSTSLLRFYEMDSRFKLIQLVKIMPSDDELDQLAIAGGYGIGAEKSLIITQESNRRIGLSDLVEKAHSRNLKVHSWVSRNEDRYLLWDYGKDPYKEYEDLINAGVDGVFTDFPGSLANYLNLRRQNKC